MSLTEAGRLVSIKFFLKQASRTEEAQYCQPWGAGFTGLWTTSPATSGVLWLIMCRASLQDAQYAAGAHLTAERSPKPPIRIGSNDSRVRNSQKAPQTVEVSQQQHTGMNVDVLVVWRHADSAGTRTGPSLMYEWKEHCRITTTRVNDSRGTGVNTQTRRASRAE